MNESTSQGDVESPILYFLSTRSVATTQEITQGVKREIHLFPADLIRASSRANECRIDQIIANALQARRTLCVSGLIERMPGARGMFRITPKGRERLAMQEAMIADLLRQLREQGITDPDFE